jgi:hypothetical protein
MSKIDWGKVGTSAASGVLGMIGGHLSERRNYRNNRKLMELQYNNQRQLNQQGHDLQFDMWNKTNYGAQKRHMMEAGLNPALMYGSAGQGGSTGSQGGGSASMGSSQQGKVMDLQNALIGAQIKNLDSITNKNNVEAGLGGKKGELLGAQARGENARALINELEGSVISENKKKYVDGLIGQWELNSTEAKKQKIALGMKENGIHNDMIATVIGTLSGWDLSEKNAMNKQVGVIPNFINDALKKADIHIEPTMTRRQVMNSLIAAYAIGKIALDKIGWLFPKPTKEFNINNYVPRN